MLEVIEEALAQRNQVVEAVLDHVRRDQRIMLPPFDRNRSAPAARALLTVGAEANPFGGQVGPYRYQFEGEDDLLHLFIVRLDSQPIRVAEAQEVLKFLLPDLPPALVWIKPGEYSQHFYFGHDELLRTESPTRAPHSS